MNHPEIRLQGLAFDQWITLIPDDKYNGKCPCGCGKAYRYVEREGEEKHFETFLRNFINAQSNPQPK